MDTVNVTIDYFLNNKTISLEDKKKLNLNKGTGYSNSCQIFYIKGQKTTLNYLGSGNWNGKNYQEGSLIIKKENYLPKIKFDKSSNKIFVDGSLRLKYTGFISIKDGAPPFLPGKGCFFVEGKPSTLDENGTGFFKETKDFYYKGLKLFFNEKNISYFLDKENNKYIFLKKENSNILEIKNYNGFIKDIFFVDGNDTTLDSEGNGYNKSENKDLSGWFYKGKLLHPDHLNLNVTCNLLNITLKEGKLVKKEIFTENKKNGWIAIEDGGFDSIQYFYDCEIKFKKLGGSFYINNEKTTLMPNGSGLILYPEHLRGVYIEGIKTDLSLENGGIFKEKKYKEYGKIDEDFCGEYNGFYFLKGNKTPLDNHGTGLVNNLIFYRGKLFREYTGFLNTKNHNAPDTTTYDSKKYGGTFYYRGMLTTLNPWGSGVWLYQNKLIYFLHGKPTTLSAGLNDKVDFYFDKKSGSYKTDSFGFGVWNDRSGEKIYTPPVLKNNLIENVNSLIPQPVINLKDINGFISSTYGATNFSEHHNFNGCWYKNGKKSPLNPSGEGFWSVNFGGKMNKIQNTLELNVLSSLNLLLGTYYVSFLDKNNPDLNIYAIPTDSLDENGNGYWENELFKSPFWINGKNISTFTGWISSIAGAPDTGTLSDKIECKKLDIYNSLIPRLRGSYFDKGKLMPLNSWPGYEEFV